MSSTWTQVHHSAGRRDHFSRLMRISTNMGLEPNVEATGAAPERGFTTLEDFNRNVPSAEYPLREA